MTLRDWLFRVLVVLTVLLALVVVYVTWPSSRTFSPSSSISNAPSP
jgi:hypothetical protein